MRKIQIVTYAVARTAALAVALLAAFLPFYPFLSNPALGQDTGDSERAEKVTGTRYALLVGVDTYLDKEHFEKLAYAEADVELIREKLIKVLKFRPEDITVLTTRSGIENTPLRDQIGEKLQSIVEKTERGDVVIFMFAGHGFEKDGNAWLCPVDGKYDRAEDTMLLVEELMKILNRSEATLKLMVLDACRENRTLRRGGDKITPYQTIENPPKGLYLYQSCKSGEYAHQDPSLEHGIFSYYLAESFEKGDLNGDGTITFLDIIKYTDERVRARARELFQNETQQPSIKTEGLSDFIMVDGLLIDNVSREDWQSADALYQKSQELRDSGKLSEAREKISKALDLTKEADPKTRCIPYKNELKLLEALIAVESGEQAEELAEAAVRLYEEGKYEEALKKLNASLALKETQISRNLKRQIEERLAAESVDAWEGSRAGESKTLTLKGVKYTFRWCPAGSFQMGSPSGEKDRYSEE